MNYELFSHPEQNKNIYLIDMTREHGYFSEMVQKGIEKYIKEQKKILLIINKKWFASWLLCTSCGHIPQCHNCSVSIGYHTTENNKSTHQHNTNSLIWLCHICKTIYELPQYCPQCHKSDSLKLYGLTLQKTEQRIQQEFGINPIIIQSETVASSAKIQRLLPELEKAQVVIGTNVIGVGSKAYDLVIILAADQSLWLPDYSVRQDTFVQLHNIIQHTNAPTVLVQSYDTQHNSIRDACKLDRDWFMQKEKAFRQDHHYPPYGELCVIKYKNENETTLHNSIQALTKELLYLQQSYEYPDLTIYATPPLVYKKFGKFYYHIIILWPQDHVRPFMDIAFSKLQMRKRWFKIDWMANHIV